MKLHERHDVSNHMKIYHLFNGLLSLTKKNTPKHCITGPLWGESTRDQKIPRSPTKAQWWEVWFDKKEIWPGLKNMKIQRN